jgi:hypothetical protein
MRQRNKARRFGGPVNGQLSSQLSSQLSGQKNGRRNGQTVGKAGGQKSGWISRLRWRIDWPSLIALIALCAILFFLFFSLGVAVGILARVAVLAIVLFAYFAVIALLDGGSRHALANRPLARTLACGVLGVVIAFLLLTLFANGEESWLLAGAMFGAALGWLGTAWARFL